MDKRTRKGALLLVIATVIITAASTRLNADTGTCGGASITLPFTDVASSNVFFCSIAEAYFSGLTSGTDSTHYSPGTNVPREQMAAFVTRTMGQSVRRASRRAALDQFWTTQTDKNLGLTFLGGFSKPQHVKFDGSDLWVANLGNGGTVSRVRASDGKLLGTWTGANGAYALIVAMGQVFIVGTSSSQGTLYQIDPTQSPGAVTTVTSSLGVAPTGIAFDGQRIWTANNIGGSVSIVTLNPLNVTTVGAGFSQPVGIIYDGANIWVTDVDGDTFNKLDSNGNILMSVVLESFPGFPTFDGTNFWVPNTNHNSVSVVRATGPLSATVLATLTGNGLDSPTQAAFDGERILVTNQNGNSVSMWKASDLTPIGTFSTGSGTTGAGTTPLGACSDGLNFWITLSTTDTLARF